MNHFKKWSNYFIFKLIYCLLFNLLLFDQLVLSVYIKPPKKYSSIDQFVDCELNLNGRFKYDSCGVCGGDNSTCNLNPIEKQSNLNLEKTKEHIDYIWSYGDYGECIPDCNQDEIRSDIKNEPAGEIGNSNSFTIGFQTSYPLCFKRIRSRHSLDEQIVNQEHCDQDQKPNIQVRSCENFVYHCKPKWIANDWSNCSAKCGIGHQKREIYCGLISRLTQPNGKPEQILRVDSLQCAGQSRPSIQRQCEGFDCSSWLEGPWSECSVSCGQGVQKRDVSCRDKNSKLSTDCKLELKPSEQQLCLKECNTVDELSLLKDQPNENWQKSSTISSGSGDNIGEEPTWIASEWSACSTECNQGKQERIVECKMLFKFSGTVATLPDDQCHAESRPENEQTCFLRPCEEENEIEQSNQFTYEKYKKKHHLADKLTNKFNEDKESSAIVIALPSEPHQSTTSLDASINEISNKNDDLQSNFNDFLSPYQWIIAGFTDCSEPCLGGTQDSIIQCVHRSNNSEVSASFCDLASRPDYVTRVCNDSPCAPRWNISEWSECSKECAKGIQTRKLNCIHEVTRGAENVIQLPNSNCSHPPPSTQQFCAIQDCEARWVILGEWSACKRRCGKKGKQTRTVKCFKLLAYGEDVEVPEIHCKEKPKPKFKKRCTSNICIPPKAKIFSQDKASRNQIKKQSKPELINKYPVNNNSEGIKRTHIDLSKLEELEKQRKSEEDKRKWKAIENFNDSEMDRSTNKKNRTANNWKIIIDSLNTESTNTDKVKYSNGLSPSNKENNHLTNKWRTSNNNHNKHNQNNHNNNLNTFMNQNNHLNKRMMYDGVSTSSASEPHSSVMVQLHHLQKLLIRLLTRKSTKKFRNEDSLKRFNKTDEDNQLETNEIEDQEEDVEDEKLANNIVDKLLLTDTGTKNLIFDWIVSEWSSCSLSGYGFQIRGLQCMVKLGNTTKAVNEAMCLNAGLRKPITIKRCGAEWKVQDWTPCNFCVKTNTGIQTRIVQCVQSNTGEAVSSKFCDKQSKPDHRKECVNLECNKLDDESQTNNPLIKNEEEIDEERTDDKL